MHFVWVGLKVVKFVDVLWIPHVFVSFVADGAHFKTVTVVAIVGAMGDLLPVWRAVLCADEWEKVAPFSRLVRGWFGADEREEGFADVEQ